MKFIQKLLAKTKYDELFAADIRALDMYRIVFLALIMIGLFAPDWSSLQIVKYVAGFLAAIALLTHITRKLMFPYIDLRKYAEKALEDSKASALVVFSMCLIVSVTIFSVAQFFK